MGILDSIKKSANEWVKGPGEEKLHNFVKGSIDSGATWFFKRTKDIIGFIVKHYEPTFSLDFVTNEKEILSIYERMKNRPDTLGQLRMLVTNNINTIHLSGEINDAIIKHLAQKNGAADEQEDSSEEGMAYKTPKIDLDDFNDTNSEYNLIVKAVNCIKNKAGAGDVEFLSIINNLEKVNPNWEHPLLSQYVINAKKGKCSKEELKKYCKKALYSNPLHKENLELAEGLEGDKGKIVYRQVLTLL